MTPPEPENAVPVTAFQREAVEARVASLRAEVEATPEARAKAPLHHELGVLAERELRNDAAAVKEYLTAYNLDPSFRPPLFALIRIFERRRSFQNLARLYEAEARSAPHDGDRVSAIVDRAVLRGDREGDPSGARTMLEQALAAEPTSLPVALFLEHAARVAAQPDIVAQALQARAEQTRDPVLKSLLYTELAGERATAGDIDAAFELVRRAASLPAGRYRALLAMERLARTHERTADLVPALEGLAMLALAEARGEDRGQSSGAFSVRRFTDEQRAGNEAAALLHEAARLRLDRHGDAAGAAQALAQAIAVRPDDVLLRQEHMLASELAGDANSAAEEARWLLEHGASGPFAASLHFRLAEHAQLSGDVTRAQAALGAAIDADPGSAAAAALLDDLLIDTGSHVERIARLEARAEREGATDAGKMRALLHAAQVAAEHAGDFPRARALYERAIAIGADKVMLLRELFGAAMRHGAGEAARDALRVLRLLPIDDDERSALWWELHDLLRGPLADEAGANEVLSEAVGTEACVRWAPDLARTFAARTRNDALLAKAHEALAARALEAESTAAHLVAAARAHLRAGDDETAMKGLRAAMSASPGHKYAVALLEEILIGKGRAEEAVALLREAAIAETGGRAAETSLLLAGAAAEASGDVALAMSTYEQAADRDPAALAPLLALRRLAERNNDTALLLKSREALAARESTVGEPGRATLELAEHYDLVASKPELAEESYRAALEDPVVGISAAAGLALLPGKHVDPAARIAALRKLHDASVDGMKRGLLRGIAAEALHGGADLAAGVEAVRMLAAIAPDDVLGSLARLRLAERDAARSRDRADAWTQLGAAAEDPEIAADLLLAAMRAKIVGQGGDAFDDAFLIAQEIAAQAPDAVAAGIALDETLAPGDDPDARVDALSARLLLAGKARPAALEGSVGRALLFAGRSEEAVRALRRVVTNDESDLASWEALRVAAREEGRFEEVARACDELAKHLDGAHAAMLLEEAAAVLMDELGRDADAERRLRKAVEIDVTRSIAFGRLHDLLAERGETAELAALVEKRIAAIDDAEELVKLYYELARLERSQGRREEALAALDNVIMLESQHVGGLALKVEVHVSLEQWREAVDALRMLADADVPAAQKRLARLGASDFLEKRLGDSEAALAELDIVADLGLEDAALHARAAGIAERAGIFDRAIVELGRAAEASSGDERGAHHRRAGEILRDKLGNRSGAAQAFERALEAAPTDALAAEALAAVSNDPQRIEVLARSFEQAVRQTLASRPTDLDALRKLARAGRLLTDADLVLRTLDVLCALGVATSEEQDELEELRRGAPTAPRGVLGPAELERLRAEGADAPPSALARLVWETVAEVDRLEPATFGVGKGELVSPKEANALRDTLDAWARAFGSSVVELYCGGPEPSAIAVTPGKKGPAWIAGGGITAPLPPPVRFVVGQLATAFAEGTLPFVQRKPEDAATMLFAAAAASESPLAAGASRSGLEELIRALGKALPRKVRKAIPDVVRTIPLDGAGMDSYCRAALRTALRGGLVASGDLAVALRAVLRSAPTPEAVEASADARDLVEFWISDHAREARRALGILR